MSECQNDALLYPSDNIYMSLVLSYIDNCWYSEGYKLCSFCSRLVLVCHERYFMICPSDNIKPISMILTRLLNSKNVGDLLNTDNPYFEGKVNQFYPPELQLNKANSSDTKARFLDLNLSNSNGFARSKIFDKRDDFDFPFLDGTFPIVPMTRNWCNQNQSPTLETKIGYNKNYKNTNTKRTYGKPN